MRNHGANALFLVILVMLCVDTSEQVPTTVDKVRITPANPNVGKLLELSNDTIAAASITLSDLLWYEYGGVRPEDIRGLTREQLTTRFDVVGTIDVIGRPDPKQHYQSQLIDALLKNHFHLKAHEDTETVSSKELRTSPGGMKLTLTPHCPCPPDVSTATHFVGHRVAMVALASWLSRKLNSEIADRTNLGGLYTIDLNWSPEGVALNFPPSYAPRISSLPPEDLLQMALDSQLGLSIETNHHQVTILTIDHIEIPSSLMGPFSQ